MRLSMIMPVMSRGRVSETPRVRAAVSAVFKVVRVITGHPSDAGRLGRSCFRFLDVLSDIYLREIDCFILICDLNKNKFEN